MSENQDAKLLITDVMAHTSTNLHYYHGVEIAVQKVLDIWRETQAADEEEDGFYSVPFLGFSKEHILLPSGLRQVFPQ